MIKKTITIIILLSITTLSFSQNSTAIMEVNYETKLISDSLNRDKVSNMEFTLLFNNVRSLYFHQDTKRYYDAISGKTKSNNNVINTSVGGVPRYPRYNSSVYKSNDTLTASLPVGKYIFNFEEPKLIWEILNETKSIKNYKCQLARTITETNDVFYAWFTSDIPIPEGPFRFKGLSGLILEVYNKNKTIEIIAIEIKKSKESIEPIKFLNLINTKSKKQYLEARKNYIENPAIYNGNIKVFTNGVETTKSIAEKLQKINVFLD